MQTGKETTDIPAFLKRIKRHPQIVVERVQGDRHVCWGVGERSIDLLGFFTAEELRAMAGMMETLQ